VVVVVQQVPQARGLTSRQVAERRATEGPNVLPRAGPHNLLRTAVEILGEPMFALLLSAGAIYLDH
jgi:Ca2+-transporting ATPase